MDEGVPQDVVHIWCLEVCLWQNQDIQLVLLHDVSNGVHLA